MTRPPAMLSAVAITLPSCAGLRIPAGVTSVPISTRSVIAASADTMDHASRIGSWGDCGPYRWSQTQRESYPMSSKAFAACAAATQGRLIWGTVTPKCAWVMGASWFVDRARAYCERRGDGNVDE